VLKVEGRGLGAEGWGQLQVQGPARTCIEVYKEQEQGWGGPLPEVDDFNGHLAQDRGFIVQGLEHFGVWASGFGFDFGFGFRVQIFGFRVHLQVEVIPEEDLARPASGFMVWGCGLGCGFGFQG